MCTKRTSFALFPAHRILVGLVLLFCFFCLLFPCDIFAQGEGEVGAAVQQYEKKSRSKGVTGSIQNGWDKFKQWVSPKKEPVTPPMDQALSVWHTVEPNAGLYVAAAKAIEDNGNLKLAEKRFQDALEEKANEPEVNLEYARFLVRRERLEEAIHFYHVYLKLLPSEETDKISKKFVDLPNRAETCNEIGMMLARAAKLGPAEHWFSLAIRQEPKNKIFRSNMATLLVRQERFQEAVEQFAAVSDQAEAHYNVGYLSANAGNLQIAREQFTLAVKMKPDFSEARHWLHYLLSIPKRQKEERVAERYRESEGIAMGWGTPSSPSSYDPRGSGTPGASRQMVADSMGTGSGASDGLGSRTWKNLDRRPNPSDSHGRGTNSFSSVPERYPPHSLALRGENRFHPARGREDTSGNAPGQSIRNPYFQPDPYSQPSAPRSSNPSSY